MPKKIQCDQFTEPQFVPVTQKRSIYSVYIATLEERKANQGDGCIIKDMLDGEEKRLKIKALIKMGLTYPNGKKVKSAGLRGGCTYIAIGTPRRAVYGVFIIPSGNRHEYLFGEQALTPGTCILWDGKKTNLIGYNQFRKLFSMQPNPVSTGQMKGAKLYSFSNQKAQNISQAKKQAAIPTQTNTSAVIRNISLNAALSGLGPNAPHSSQPQILSRSQQALPQQPQKLEAVARITNHGTLCGLVLSDGREQRRINLPQCIVYARDGKIKNIKAVTRDSNTFLMGNGITLESLPPVQI